jgi:hypothetical protein
LQKQRHDNWKPSRVNAELIAGSKQVSPPAQDKSYSRRERRERAANQRNDHAANENRQDLIAGREWLYCLFVNKFKNAVAAISTPLINTPLVFEKTV